MKIKYLIFFVLAANIFLWSQTQEINCCTKSSESLMDLTQRGGKYLTSLGDLKILVVFAKFKNDTSQHQHWSADSYPSEMNNFIDSNMQAGSTHFLNLTNYYNRMSFGNFRVTGKVIGAETPYPISHYISINAKYPDRSQANTDILKSIDDQIDYEEFDNWTYIDNYNHKNEPDGVVDMIVVIWRGLVFTDQWSGESSLGGGSEFLVENNQIKIKLAFEGYPGKGIYGSGVTVQYWGEKTRERNFKVVIHEVAHWFLGREHPYSSYKHTFWGMLTLAGEGICANAFEREKLGWLNPTPIVENILSAPIGDFITTPSAYKYHPPNGFYGEMFYFENHQQISIYDNGTSNPDDKGIFVLHLANGYYIGDCVRILTSDGFWNWEVPFNTDCWGNDLPAFQKKSVNRNGFGNRDKILSTDSCCGLLYTYINEKGEVECNDWLHGYGFSNSFNTTFNDVFSTWSNPPAKTYAGKSVDFLMEVINQSGSIVTVRFVTQNVLSGKPSKPPLGINLECMDNQNQSKFLNLVWGSDYWDTLSIESDVNWSELQMKIDSGIWETIYSGSNRFWTDSNYVYDINGNAPIAFRVRVRDSQSRWSMWSDVYETIKTKEDLVSLDFTTENNLSGYYLYQNSPNPFNPRTKIRWQSPVSCWQTLKVYDMLGREIATLVDEYRSAGGYEVVVNVGQDSSPDIASGIYFYRFQAGNFVETKKMILLK